jgi:hypothetical protein
MRRRQTVLSRTIASSFRCSLVNYSRSFRRARNAATKLCASRERHGVRRGQRIEGADRRSLVAAAETYGFALAEGASKRMAEHFEAKRNAVLSYNR